MAELIYPELSYTVQGALYDVFNLGLIANFHAPSLEIETVRI